MRRASGTSVIAIVATLGLLLGACADDPEADPAASDASADAAEADAEDEPDTTDMGDDASDDADVADGGSDEAAGNAAAGTAVVVVGDERYETSELNCTEASSGTQFGSVSEGPHENSQIRGLFGSEFLPDLVAVTFDGGDGGEWRALADDGLSVLEDYTFDEAVGAFEGTATFVWFEAGLEDGDRLGEGTFEVRCG